MKHERLFTVGFAICLEACASERIVEPTRAEASEIAEPTDIVPEAPRYAEVAPIFAAHCDRCHNASTSDNAKAQAVFESSRYPFATERPETLLSDLRDMFEVREALSEEQRRLGLAWIDGGALDDSGRRPPWNPR